MSSSKEHSVIELQDMDRAHHLHPFTDQGDLNKRGSRIVSSGKGVYIWDANGHKMLDAMAGLWCVNVGYGREELAQTAFEQMKELPYYNSFFQCTTAPTVMLADKIASVAPEHMNTVFFTNSGSEANQKMLSTQTICYLSQHPQWVAKPSQTAQYAHHLIHF